MTAKTMTAKTKRSLRKRMGMRMRTSVVPRNGHLDTPTFSRTGQKSEIPDQG